MKLKILALVMAVAMTFSLTGCSKPDGKDDKASDAASPGQIPGGEADFEYPVSEFGANVTSRPGKIMSLSPAITEKIFELGLQDRLEGISDFCDEPDNSSRIRCGTAQTPDWNSFAEINPHLILTEAEIGEDVRTSLLEYGAQIATIPKAATAEELKRNYKVIAKLLDGEKTGGALGDVFGEKIDEKLAEVSANALPEPKNAVYVRFLDYIVATGDTLESELMELAGFNNIARDYTDWTYPEEDANSEAGRANFVSLDFIYCDRQSVTMRMMEQSAYYKGLNAVRKDYYLYIDSSAFERQTMRMFTEIERMRQYAMGELEGGAAQEQQVQ